MSRCLSHALVKYQKDLDLGIKELTKEWDESDSELAQRLIQPDRVSSEDLSRQYSPEDVRQLCLRTKVRVDMTLFNCLWDAKKRFDKKERLKNRSEVFINKMYIKAVAKKMVIPYEPKEIEKSVHIRRCILKKRNNLRLDRWNNLPTQESSTSLSIEEISEDQEPSLMLAQIPNGLPSNPNGTTNLHLDRSNNLPIQASLPIQEISEDQEPSLMLAQIPNELASNPNGSTNLHLDRSNNLQTQASLPIQEISEDQEPSLMLAQIPNGLASSPDGSRVASDNTINYPVADISSGPISSEPQLWHFGNTESEVLQLPTIAVNEDVNMSKNAGAKNAKLAINNESKDAQKSKEESSEKSGVDWENAAMAIDPESMTIDSDMQTPQTESEPMAEDYSIFNTQVPCTSTQSTQNTDDFL
ncbi:telomere-binding protein cav isoform X1 [Drosophila albomicans]|uniref:Telomere-binding protein cav isoform X1 n=1 Tax=Drosophila albomicans TaxID=7291 RepID=A0A6P8XQA5_DROAB|nr:telomere-binding protein cav isoform X1 [Drosophila albomicans]